MKFSDLKHGDVLLYEHKKKASLFVRGIRFITGSRIEHCGIVLDVDNQKFILEQMSERMHSYLPFYYAKPGEVIHCVRPKFAIPEMDNKTLCKRIDYGYLSICDCLLNHLFGRITFGNWVYRPMLKRWFNTQTIICSTLVATALKLNNNVKWCNYLEVVEPDDYWNHTEDFMYIGIVDWS